MVITDQQKVLLNSAFLHTHAVSYCALRLLCAFFGWARFKTYSKKLTVSLARKRIRTYNAYNVDRYALSAARYHTKFYSEENLDGDKYFFCQSKGDNLMAWDFYDAVQFLKNHPMFDGMFWDALDIFVVKVNPDTNAIDDDKSKNTKTQVWLETGRHIDERDMLIPGCSPFSHDYYLDCGGDTFEEAIIQLADLVLKYYGRNSKRSINEDKVSPSEANNVPK